MDSRLTLGIAVCPSTRSCNGSMSGIGRCECGRTEQLQSAIGFCLRRFALPGTWGDDTFSVEGHLLLFVSFGVNIGAMPLSDATIRQHRAQVFKYLRRRTQSDELADDLTQEVFETAAAHLGALDQSKPLLAWLYRVAQNRLIDELRRGERRPLLVALDADALAEPAREFGPEVANAIRRASMRLTDRDREILGLRLFAECSFAEVARRLHINEPAAKMRYVRALRCLRAELEQEGVTDE